MQRMNPEVFRETHLSICLSTDQDMPVMKPLGSGEKPSKRMSGNSTQGSQRDRGPWTVSIPPARLKKLKSHGDCIINRC